MSSLWQECRAYVATILFGWAQRVHFGTTMDLARGLASIEAEAAARGLADVPPDELHTWLTKMAGRGDAEPDPARPDYDPEDDTSLPPGWRPTAGGRGQ